MAKLHRNDRVKVGLEKVHKNSWQGEYGTFVSYVKTQYYTHARVLLDKIAGTVLIDPRELFLVDRTKRKGK